MIDIKHRFTGEVVCTGETIAAAVQQNLANLYWANLSDANLSDANLRDANLRGANLSMANLSMADLYGADLRDADLRDADLRGADLRGANLRGANLGGADLYWANLSDANLSDADLRGANLGGADLGGANLRGAKIAWQSHDLLAEILKRSSGDDVAKLKVAGLILVCRDKCWREFLAMRDCEPLAGWALDVLAEWVQDDDGAPDVVRKIAEAKKSESKDAS